MATLMKVTEWNGKQASPHMKFQGEEGPYKRGYVVVDKEGAARYFKSQAEAETFKLTA